MRFVLALALASAICVAAISQRSADATAYDVEEAYQIYNLLLPQEEAFGFAKGTLVIQEETVQKTEAGGICVSKEAATQFKDAIADYDRVNRKQWLLQRQFQSNKPYELVSSDTIQLIFKTGPAGWGDFYNRYPNSGGYIIFSAVGFNKDKTRAAVYSGSACGGLCGRWSFHLLEKVDGKWKTAPGVTCTTVS